jgi:hypothetical protein
VTHSPGETEACDIPPEPTRSKAHATRRRQGRRLVAREAGAFTAAATSVRYFRLRQCGILKAPTTRIGRCFKGSVFARITVNVSPLALCPEEAMSVGEWKPIPPGLLKMKMTPRGFGRLEYDVQVLISQLAEEQGYKCALCSQNHSLEIEHDHDPEYGTGRYRRSTISGD